MIPTDLAEAKALWERVWMCGCGCCPISDDIAKARQSLGVLIAECEQLRADRSALTTRRDELLATIARLSNELPFPDEVKGWTEQRAKLLAEIGTLKAEREELRRKLGDRPDGWEEYHDAL